MSSPEQTINYRSQLLQEMNQARPVLARRASPVLPTEIIRDEQLSSEYEANIFYASELGQRSGSFKTRGAEYSIYNMTYEERKSGLVTVTEGNHGLSIALSSKWALDNTQIEMPVDIFMPIITPDFKIARITELGEDAVNKRPPEGENFEESLELAKAYAEAKGKTFISPYDGIRVIAGQATLAAEICEAVPNIDMAICPIGGGGLIAGTSVVIKDKNPNATIIGVEPEGAASWQYAVEQGKPSPLPGEISTYVDGAAVRQVGELPFKLASHLVDLVIGVPDHDLREAVTWLWESPSRPLKVELAAGLPLAGLRRYRESIKGKNVVLILSGRTISLERYENEVRV